MTTNDAPHRPDRDEPERIGQLFGEVFDLVDETVAGITDAEVDRALQSVYRGQDLREPTNLDELAELLTGTDWTVSRTSPAGLLRNPGELAEWTEVNCALRAAWDEVTAVRAAAAAARADAQVHTAAAARARRQAEEVTAGAKAFVDQALDEAEAATAAARKEAARLIADAEQRADEIIAAARARTGQPSSIADWAEHDVLAAPRQLLIAGARGAGKTRLAADLLADLAQAGAVIFAATRATWDTRLIAPLAAADLAGVAAVAHLLEPATWAVRDVVAHYAAALRALTAPDESSRCRHATGSLRRSTVIRYTCDDELDVDLVLKLPSHTLAAHPGPAAGTAPWADVWATRLSRLDCPAPRPADTDDGDIAMDQALTWVRMADGGDDAAFRRLLLQVKTHVEAADTTLPAPASFTVTCQSLLLYLCQRGPVDQVGQPGVDELYDALTELAGGSRAGRLAIGGRSPDTNRPTEGEPVLVDVRALRR